ELPAEKRAGRTYRLPTEAEWEYACRGGAPKPARFSFGDTDKELGEHGWSLWSMALRPGRVSYKHTHPVGQLAQNGFGLYDKHGNVAEWCSDWYAPDYYSKSPADDPRGPDTGTWRVHRGGSFASATVACRCAARSCRSPTAAGGFGSSPTYQGAEYVGFRVA